MFQQSWQCRRDRVVDPVEHNVDRVAECPHLSALLAKNGQYPGIGEHEVEPSQLDQARRDGRLEPVEVPDVTGLREEGGETLVDLAVTTVNQRDEIVVTGPASAAVDD